MSNKRQKADPNQRREALRYVLIAASAGVSIILIYRALFIWAASDEGLMVSRLAIVIATLYLPALPALRMCRRLWALGSAVSSSQRFPPPGIKVVRDTPVVTGRSAVFRGAVLHSVSIITGILLVVTPPILWWLLWYVTASHH